VIVALVGDKPGVMVVGGDCRIAVVDFVGAPLYVGYDRRLGIPKRCGLIFLLVAQSVVRTHAHRQKRTCAGVPSTVDQDHSLPNDRSLRCRWWCSVERRILLYRAGHPPRAMSATWCQGRAGLQAATPRVRRLPVGPQLPAHGPGVVMDRHSRQ
jgi:hypothetical protein